MGASHSTGSQVQVNEAVDGSDMGAFYRIRTLCDDACTHADQRDVLHQAFLMYSYRGLEGFVNNFVPWFFFSVCVYVL